MFFKLSELGGLKGRGGENRGTNAAASPAGSPGLGRRRRERSPQGVGALSVRGYLTAGGRSTAPSRRPGLGPVSEKPTPWPVSTASSPQRSESTLATALLDLRTLGQPRPLGQLRPGPRPRPPNSPPAPRLRADSASGSRGPASSQSPHPHHTPAPRRWLRLLSPAPSGSCPPQPRPLGLTPHPQLPASALAPPLAPSAPPPRAHSPPPLPRLRAALRPRPTQSRPFV